MLRKWENVFAAEEEEINFWGNDCTNLSIEEVG